MRLLYMASSLRIPEGDIPDVGKRKSVVLLVARMQPPTSAHAKLVAALSLIAEAMKTRGELPYIKIILSISYNLPDNPLHCDEYKKKLVEDIYDLVKVEGSVIPCDVICAPSNRIYSAISDVVRNFQYGVWVCGSDRKPDYIGMIDSINTMYKAINDEYIPSHIKVKSLQRTGDEEEAVSLKNTHTATEEVVPREEQYIDDILNSIDIDSSMSGSNMRKLVSTGRKATFIENMMGTGIEDAKLEEVYDKILNSDAPRSNNNKRLKSEGGKPGRKCTRKHRKKSRKRRKKSRKYR
jgi:hypothetical protein